MENPDIAPNAARCRFRRIVVKVGSNVLTRADGTLDTDRMAALADQIAALHRAGVEVIVVSSGAVAAGRGVIAAGHRLDAVSARQLYSAVGQVKLIRRYYELFDARGIVCGQVLTTKQDFETRRHYLNQRNSIRVMLENGVVPIVNENDTVAVTELMFTDNDELSGLLSTMIGAEALVLLTNVDGICDGTPGAPGVEVIREIAPGQRDLPDCIRDAKSSFGRGGMLTKSRIARKVAAEGIETIIADGRRDGILPDLLAEGSRTLCTRFLPRPTPSRASRSGSPTRKDSPKGGARDPRSSRCARRPARREPAARRREPRGGCLREGRHRAHRRPRRPAGRRRQGLLRQHDGTPQYRPPRCTGTHTLRLPLSGLTHGDATHSFRRARETARALNRTASERIDRLLLALADAVEAGTEELLAANARDRSRMNPADPAYDRLLLDRGRLLGIAADLRNVAALPSPLGRILDRTVRPNGMEIRKVSVPFGVVGVIYEARPNVGFDVFALCVKSGNACILKGGSDARDSNAAIAALIRRTLAAHGFDENTLALLPPTHEATAALLGATGLVDLVIPRGGRGLIDFVRDHARVPVIETGAGVCHAYFDRSGDTEKGAAIVLNAKTRRVSVCNALDTLVVHRDRLTDLPRLCRPLAEKGVELQADEAARTALHGNYPAALLRAADTASFGTEFLSLRLSIRTVASLDEALAHIARYSSQHSETIIAEDAEAIRTFQREVDAACVYANVSTAFTDGAQFGMGAEIGISTQKLHARGPMALRELTSYKYLIAGDGQTRP